MFSKKFITKIKNSINLLDLANEYTEMKNVGINIWQGRCPHPDHNDSSPSFNIWKNNDKNNQWSWCCMGCHQGKKNTKFKNYGSDCFAFVQWMSDSKNSSKKLNWRDSIILLAKKANIPLEEDACSDVYKKLNRIAAAYNNNLVYSVKQYLYDRGLNNADIAKWKIGFNGCSKRITFPLFDRYNQVLGFSNRKIINTDNNEPKYKNSANSNWFNKKSYLYGINFLDDDCDEIRITEGVFDVILAQKYNVKNIVATLGTSFTTEHAEIIRNLKKTPCFCMDGDIAGIRSIKRSIDIMASIGVFSKVLIMPNNMDIADLSNNLKDETEVFISNNTMTYWQYILKDIVTQYDSKINDIRAKIMPSIQLAQQSINNDTERVLLNSFVKEKFGIFLAEQL